jgi:hypothetical protein
LIPVEHASAILPFQYLTGSISCFRNSGWHRQITFSLNFTESHPWKIMVRFCHIRCSPLDNP